MSISIARNENIRINLDRFHELVITKMSNLYILHLLNKFEGTDGMVHYALQNTQQWVPCNAMVSQIRYFISPYFRDDDTKKLLEYIKKWISSDTEKTDEIKSQEHSVISQPVRIEPEPSDPAKAKAVSMNGKKDVEGKPKSEVLLYPSSGIKRNEEYPRVKRGTLNPRFDYGSLDKKKSAEIVDFYKSHTGIETAAHFGIPRHVVNYLSANAGVFKNMSWDKTYEYVKKEIPNIKEMLISGASLKDFKDTDKITYKRVESLLQMRNLKKCLTKEELFVRISNIFSNGDKRILTSVEKILPLYIEGYSFDYIEKKLSKFSYVDVILENSESFFTEQEQRQRCNKMNVPYKGIFA